MNGYVIGIDGGGTKTELVAWDEKKNVLFEKIVSGSNIYGSNEKSVENTLSALLQECVSFLQKGPSVICMGAAGMIGGDAEKFFKNTLSSAGNCRDVLIFHDAKISLTANFHDNAGVSLTAGTGSICVAQNSAGNMFRVGGWGHLMSDEGSAYSIAVNALRATALSFDGRGESTALLKAFLTETGCESFEQLVAAVYENYAKKSALAGLAGVVTKCARNGDKVALNVLEKAAEELFSLCASVIEKGGFAGRKFGICFNGGVLKYDDIVKKSLALKLRNSYDCIISENTVKAVYGAAELALKSYFTRKLS